MCAGVCACLLRKEMPVCGAHPLSLLPPWPLSPGEAGGGWGIIVVTVAPSTQQPLRVQEKTLVQSPRYTPDLTASLWLLCSFLSRSTKN